ncbi:pilus assembly protein [Luteimonas sp. XNQY3]|nr:PilX N-terminal domain-containing pilus assembly protein [Luteimonas sp. XNQY3]MCD9005139.1 pilus assembly protein [Luteimonas sp. XNQY3]
MSRDVLPPSSSAFVRRQSGISLVVVMVLLVITALLGIAILRSSMMQERMSANVRDRSVAFQGAEAALRYAHEDVLGAGTWDIDTPAPGDACTELGVCPAGAAPSWVKVPDSAYDFAEAGLVVEPEYWIEYIGTGPARIGSCETTSASLDCQSPIYRITARSRSDGRADVVIQASVMSRIPDMGI